MLNITVFTLLICDQTQFYIVLGFHLFFLISAICSRFAESMNWSMHLLPLQLRLGLYALRDIYDSGSSNITEESTVGAEMCGSCRMFLTKNF